MNGAITDRDGKPCEWTRKEERALFELVEDMGTGCWETIAAVMGRTKNACQARYYKRRNGHRKPAKRSYHDVGNFHADITRDRIDNFLPPRPETHVPGFLTPTI